MFRHKLVIFIPSSSLLSSSIASSTLLYLINTFIMSSSPSIHPFIFTPSLSLFPYLFIVVPPCIHHLHHEDLTLQFLYRPSDVSVDAWFTLWAHVNRNAVTNVRLWVRSCWSFWPHLIKAFVFSYRYFVPPAKQTRTQWCTKVLPYFPLKLSHAPTNPGPPPVVSNDAPEGR